MKYDYIIFINRFQPFHLGHKKVIKEALAQAKNVILLVASSYTPRAINNPWSFKERKKFIRSSFTKKENKNIIIYPLKDHLYKELSWIRSIQKVVKNITKKIPNPKIALLTHKKSSYAKYFPTCQKIETLEYFITSKEIREAYFEDKEYKKYLPKKVAWFLEEFKNSKEYKILKQEYLFIKEYKKKWECAPYEPIFVTVDAIVIQAGHLLLIKRKNYPGKGVMAFAGGFVEPNEKLEDAMLRELKEETKIDVSKALLRQSITKNRVFDDPNRSLRGRIITHAYVIELRGNKLAKIKGADDAKEAKWVALADIKSQNMFEDHYYILEAMLL